MRVAAEHSTEVDGFNHDLFALLASGVMDAYRRVAGGMPLTLPYPVSLQRALNRLTLKAFAAAERPPAGVPELLRWCHEDPGSWPLSLGPFEAEIGALLSGGVPTRACQEWAVEAADVESELFERRIVDEVRALCRAAERPDAYVAWRRFLIDRPVVTEFELTETLLSQPLGVLRQPLRACYPLAPSECHYDGAVACCADCGNLLVRVARQLNCLDDRCSRKGPAKVGRTIPLELEPRWLAHPLRMFVSSPGRAELGLRKRLEGVGARVELWPNYDLYDLRVTFEDGVTWAVDVKDWANPYLLARRVQPVAPDGWSEAFIVPSAASMRNKPGYLRVARAESRSRLARSGTRVVSETWLMREAAKHGGGNTDA